MSDEEDEDVLAGFRPTINAVTNVSAGALDDDDDDDDEEVPATAAPAALEEEDTPTGLLDANAAFEDDAASSLELDPFRVAGPVAAAEKPDDAAASAALKAAGAKKSSKIFVGGLSYGTTDSTLLKFFTRYGKVSEASVVLSEEGKSRGFGFVTFVHLKGAAYCLQQAGEQAQIQIDGRNATVRYAEDKGGGVPHFKMPARGQYSHKPAKQAVEQRAPGGVDMGGAGSAAGKRRAGGEDESAGRQQRAKRKKEEIVTVTRRPDAEALYDKPITLRELFPKEFWRI